MAWSFVFPGQGSQSPNMMAPYGDQAIIRDTFAEASDALNEDLWQLATDGDEKTLALTTNTQPLMLTAGIAVYRLWQSLGGHEPEIVAGHSLGEYSALVAANVLDFADAVPLVRFRAEVMQTAVPEGVGAMAAIMGLSGESLIALCATLSKELERVVEPVNFNAKEQTVIAGHKEAVLHAMELSSQSGAKRAVLLPVSAPFHSSLMRPVAKLLADRLADIPLKAPSISVIHNIDGQTRDTPEAIAQALAHQACSPVRWVDTIIKLGDFGVTTVAECGPGKVLSGLTKRCDKTLTSLSFSDLARMETVLLD